MFEWTELFSCAMPSLDFIMQYGMAEHHNCSLSFYENKKATGKTGETTLNDCNKSTVGAGYYKSQHLMSMYLFLNLFYHLLCCLYYHNYYLIS